MGKKDSFVKRGNIVRLKKGSKEERFRLGDRPRQATNPIDHITTSLFNFDLLSYALKQNADWLSQESIFQQPIR